MGDILEIKLYMLDTNAFRYKTSPSTAKEYKKAARHFWSSVLEEIKNEVFIGMFEKLKKMVYKEP